MREPNDNSRIFRYSLIGMTCMLLTIQFSCAQEKPIRLIVRGDDMGMARSVNQACIQSYEKGFMKSVEVMVPAPWYMETVALLNENPGLDVGVHLVLTSEWDNIKSRPLTNGKSFVDENGYYYPMVWPGKHFRGRSLSEQSLDLEEVEAELRAQIELAKRHIPHISHLSAHMGFTSLNSQLQDLFEQLGKEYGLDIFLEDFEVKKARYQFDPDNPEKKKELAFIRMLESLEPGTHMFLDHPGLDTPELQGFFHKGYENVAQDRAEVTELFTSDKVKQVIKELGIEVIGYKDLRELNKN